MNDESSDLVPVFVPALCALLIAAEDKKGSPLTEEEAIEIRDNGSCIMMKPADAEKMTESRGPDINPRACWYDWQMLRRELGRKPDLDPGPLVRFIQDEDPEYLATVKKAQDSLSTFWKMAQDRDPYTLMIKTRVADSAGHVFAWLFNPEKTSTGFTAEFFEVPAPLRDYRAGDRINILAEDITDWMINDDGTLYGGFSLRYQRELLSEEERPAFDAHIGVTNYA